MEEKHECPYCDPSRRLPLNHETSKYSGIEITVMAEFPQIRARYGYDPEWAKFCVDGAQDAIGIKYCPMCGRKLDGRRHSNEPHS